MSYHADDLDPFLEDGDYMPGQTEWDDILIQKGVRQGDVYRVSEKEKALRELAGRSLAERREEERSNRIDNRLNELRLGGDEDETLNDDDDERMAMERLRAARLAALKKMASKSIFGQVYTLRQDEFVAEVSKASGTGQPLGGGAPSAKNAGAALDSDDEDDEEDDKKIHSTSSTKLTAKQVAASNESPRDPVFVFVHLYDDNQPESGLLDKYLPAVASKFRHVKFCRIKAQDAIPNFPLSKCPTCLIYYNSNIILHIEKLALFGGAKISSLSIEWALGQPIKWEEKLGGKSTVHTLRILHSDLPSNPLLGSSILNRQKASRLDSDDSDDNEED